MSKKRFQMIKHRYQHRLELAGFTVEFKPMGDELVLVVKNMLWASDEAVLMRVFQEIEMYYNVRVWGLAHRSDVLLWNPRQYDDHAMVQFNKNYHPFTHLMKKAKEILNGWKNVIIPNDDVEALSQQRLSICNDCPFKQMMMGMEVCGQCHCPLVAKSRSVESICPQNRW